MEALYQNLLTIEGNQVIMWIIGGVLIYLAIVKEMEPTLLLPVGFGAAAQFGIFFTLCLASLCGFELKDAASIAIIGAADGPTSIFVATQLGSNYMSAIMVAAYSYMALVRGMIGG